jgi:hypothetical protein
LAELSRAIESCKRFEPKEMEWGYDFSGVTFMAEPQRHMIPNIEKAKQSIQIELRLHLRGVCLPNESEADPLSELAVQIILNSRAPDGTPLRFAWHIDRDLGIFAGDEIHPRYHVQHAGRIMRESSTMSWGSSMFLDVPRFAYMPLDALLAIDLVLSSYLPTAWADKCRADTYYNSLLRVAQRRYWKPYILALASAWNTGTVHDCASKYLPQLSLAAGP